MTKDELQGKRTVALSELKNIEVALCLDEHYIDIIEKENAKLISDFRICEKNADTYYDQLTKAKEIIKMWLRWANDDVESTKFQEIVNQAEQFLKETEKC